MNTCIDRLPKFGSAAILIMLCLTQAARTQDPLSVKISDSVRAQLALEPSPRFELMGIEVGEPSTARELFTIRVFSKDSSENQTPAVFGTYQVAGKTVSFVPRFPLSPSVVYEMHLSDELKKQLNFKENLRFGLPHQTLASTATVAHIFPSASELPENLLKFYVHFSEPMSRGEAYQRIQLFQGDELVESPFLELGEELWDAEQTRFTLFVHPGRIKRGVKPREDDGPPMQAGKHYTLKISQDWKTAEGLGLAAPMEKKFSVIPPDDQQLNPERWKIETPVKDSRDAVGLAFDEPLDHAMLQRVLTVENYDGQRIEGQSQVAKLEMQWTFTPDQPWRVGRYFIEVATNLEDLCGNSIARPFEVKMQDRSASQPTTKIAIEFVVK